MKAGKVHSIRHSWHSPRRCRTRRAIHSRSQSRGRPAGNTGDQNLGRFRLSVTDDPTAFDREKLRLRALQLTDPWAQLAAAYHVGGDQPALDKLLEQHPAARGVIDEWNSLSWQETLEASDVGIKSAQQLPDGTWDLDLEGAAITDLTILKGMPISRLNLKNTAVSDLTPLRDMALKSLNLAGTKVTDLTPLQSLPLEDLNLGTLSTISDLTSLRGMPLQSLAVNGTGVADLEPLRGMALKGLAMHGTKVTDLQPLQGMPLETLNLKATKVTDLSVLRGMPLTTVEFLGCPDLTDLSPLAEAKGLNRLILPPNAKAIEFLRTFPKLEHIGFLENPQARHLPDKTAAEFWKDYDSQGWLRDLRASGLAIKSGQQLPDGTWNLDLEGATITDLSILKGLPPISRLSLKKTGVSDLTPLRGMALKSLDLEGTKVTDLTTLRGMPLEQLMLNQLPISDLTIVRGLPLQKLELNSTPVFDLEPLRGMAFKQLAISNTKVTDLQPLKGMPLEYLNLVGIAVTDLSPLRGMPLTNVRLIGCRQLTDLSPLSEAKGLTLLTLPPNATEIEFLRTFPKLERLSFSQAQPQTHLPAQITAEFWKEYDTQDWLKALRASGVAIKSSQQLPDATWDLNLEDATITDLTILKGTPISRLNLKNTAVSDLTPLGGMALKSLSLEGTKVTDLTPLQGLPLEDLTLNFLPISDLSFLADCPSRDSESTAPPWLIWNRYAAWPSNA